MRTLNFRLTAVLFVVVTVIVGSTHWLHSYQLQRKSSSFKIQAEAAWNATPMRYSDAVALMASYLRLRPDDCEAREELGAWYLALHKLDTASKMLEELVRALEKQNPPDVAAIQRVRWKLIDTDMQQGRCGDALYHLDVLAKELPSERAGLEPAREVPDQPGARRGGHRELQRTESHSDRTASTSTPIRPWPCVILPCRKNRRKPRSAWPR